MMWNDSVKRKLKERKTIIYGMVRFQNPVFASILAKAGAESITIDNEHYPFTEDDIKNICRAVHAEGSVCLVRLGTKSLDAIYRVMDMGVDGVIIPNVETAEEARMVVDAVKYPPAGRRGCCPITLGADYGIGKSVLEYYPQANEHSIVGLMIESKKGYANLDSILDVSGIDFFSIGPSDFSGSFGKPGQAATDPEIKAAMTDAYRRIIKAGYSVSGLSYTPEQAEENLKFGKNILNIGSDLQILCREFTKHVKGAENVVGKPLAEMTKGCSLRDMLRKKEPVLLPYIRIADPASVELAALCGVKAMVLDDEHFPFDDRQLVSMIRAAHCRGASCLVRVHDKKKSSIGRILDMGADGIVAPQVGSYKEALSIVEAAKYAPLGKRGLCPIAPGADFGYGHCASEYAEEANKRIVVGIMVETKGAVDDLDKILSIEGLDYVSVGPSDISASYGLPGQYDHPVVKKVMEETWNKVRKSCVALSGQCYSNDKIAPAVEAGKTVLNIGSDLQYLTWGVNGLLASIHEKIKEYGNA